jgi:hypothetical protein
MYTIENKTTSMLKAENEPVNYAELLTTVLNRPLQKLLSVKDMRRDIILLDKFETAKESITLTDEEYKHVSALVEASEWHFRHKELLVFIDDILTVEPETEEEPKKTRSVKK